VHPALLFRVRYQPPNRELSGLITKEPHHDRRRQVTPVEP
jgi:hypothetical protein